VAQEKTYPPVGGKSFTFVVNTESHRRRRKCSIVGRKFGFGTSDQQPTFLPTTLQSSSGAWP
jgi:hypothetical protein